MRLLRFAFAAITVAGAAYLAFSARFRVAWDRSDTAVIATSEIAPPPEPQPTRPRSRAPQDLAATPAAPPPPAEQAEAGAELPIIANPQWIARPANPERFYPRAAFLDGVEGRVELDCFVELDGRLTCEIAAETPPDHGFGDAALAVASAHVMQPATRDGAPIRARFRMIVPFANH
jgi:TonB family protein